MGPEARESGVRGPGDAGAFRFSHNEFDEPVVTVGHASNMCVMDGTPGKIIDARFREFPIRRGPGPGDAGGPPLQPSPRRAGTQPG